MARKFELNKMDGTNMNAKFNGNVILLRYFIENELLDTKNYIYENEENITRLQNRLNDTIEKFGEGVDGDFKEAMQEEHFEEEIIRYKHYYPELFYSSMVIWLYSFLENYLKQLCEMIEERGLYKIKIVDFGKIGIDRYEKYLRLVVGLEDEILRRSWGRIQQYELLRNILVHNSGTIIKNKNKPVQSQSTYNSFNNQKFLKVNLDSGKVEITKKDYLIKFAEEIEVYLISIINLIYHN